MLTPSAGNFAVKSAPTDPVSGATATRIGVKGTIMRPPPVSLSTGGGQSLVYHPPTRVAPPNATDAVMQQLENSNQLDENTATGAGIGAGRSSSPISFSMKTPGAYTLLAGLGAVLILAVAWDMGKL